MSANGRGHGDRERPPFLGVPYPMLDYALGDLPGDYGKIMLRVAQLARATPTTVDGIALDIGEALIDERSEKIWGGLRLDREVSPDGRRALVRRVLERLERDGWISRRAARARGPGSNPRTGPRNGPSPTVVRFLKFRAILWPAAAEAAQETARGSAQETAQANGPILPVSPPAPPFPPGGRRARAKLGPLGEKLMASVAAGAGSALTPLTAQDDAENLEFAISQCFVGVDGALEYIAQTCRERSVPGKPYVPRTQLLVLEMLRDVRPAVLRSTGSADR